ncbi:ABC transporter substrate-binding protein [Halobaculum magnesiiphilum]|uniref:Twin-arginine translocation signal domain-containing protein n=1 Tax=Halobaculum magnesiiphilum TaxID=1017351 RepID=A0A8T8WD12_9EURY|nr:ABC transporter substrate-binding protein [Halobaculum magnesiiphilum]QZP37686.1 twin-arginine translocation signal domain-containing protein [Halobaculum magnesiiphilum]
MSDNQSGSSRRRFLQGTGVAAVSAGLAGCSGNGGDGTETPGDESTPTPDQTPTEVENTDDIPTGGIFDFGMGTSPNTLNVLASSSAYVGVITDRIYESGAAIDPVNFEMHPNVFTDWDYEVLDETGEDDRPNVEVYFNVRTDGLTWNDGEEFTVDDVIFSYNYLMEQNPGGYAASINPIVSVEEHDGDWDCVMTLSQPNGTFAYDQLGLPILPEHRWGDVDDYQTYEPADTDFGPVGLGPGVVTQYDPDTAVEVSFADRQGEYNLSELSWREEVSGIIAGGPFIDAMRIRVYSSTSALHQALFQGDIDSLYDGVRTSRIGDAQEDENIELYDGFDTGYSHYSFNLRRTPLDDLPFRQALSFAFDDFYWTQQLLRDYAQEGDFVMPPGYTAVRPETGSDQELLEGPSTQAFSFRQSSPSIPDVEAIRSFLTEGQMITGEEGTFVGQEYPGSLTGVTASQTEPKHDYSFGPVESEVLQESDAEPDQEIRVNGETLTEVHDGPLTMLLSPAQEAPQTAQMVSDWITSLHEVGIPIDREVVSFNTRVTRAYGSEDFDIFSMGWVNLSPFATNTLYSLFHSDNADDHSVAETEGDDENTSTLFNNAMGYGLFEDASADDLIDEARTTLDAEPRNQASREAVERIYLDFPTMVTNYGVPKWPVSTEWSGAIENIPGPGSTYLGTQIMQLHQNE